MRYINLTSWPDSRSLPVAIEEIQSVQKDATHTRITLVNGRSITVTERPEIVFQMIGGVPSEE